MTTKKSLCLRHLMSSHQNRILNLSVENYQLILINQELMALITSGAQYVALRAIKDVFWMRHKNCGAVFYSNSTLKKSIHNIINDPFLESNDPNNGHRTTCDRKYAATLKEKKIIKLLVNELKVKEEVVLNEIMKHPKRKFLNICQIQESLKFLQYLGFSKQVIAELPAICFYPRGNIEAGLQEITRNAAELNKLGYVDGVLKDDTNGFLCGSKSNNKRLQLCLYYMELPFDFNGNGIFHIDGYSDLYNSEKE